VDLHGRLAQNNNTSGSGTYGIPEVVHGEDSTRVGKFLQKGILKEVRLTQVKSKSTLTPSSRSIPTDYRAGMVRYFTGDSHHRRAPSLAGEFDQHLPHSAI
jgi:hypothetical protein